MLLVATLDLALCKHTHSLPMHYTQSLHGNLRTAPDVGVDFPRTSGRVVVGQGWGRPHGADGEGWIMKRHHSLSWRLRFVGLRITIVFRVRIARDIANVKHQRL